MKTIHSIRNSTGNFHYCIFNDFSTEETTKELRLLSSQHQFELINLSEITTTPSPNYRLVLQLAQQKALELGLPLIIVESDVEVRPNTLSELVEQSRKLPECGMVGAITRDTEGKINFPYLNFKSTRKEIIKTSHSLSFCCTLLTNELLKKYDFKSLSAEKHWYDVFNFTKINSTGIK